MGQQAVTRHRPFCQVGSCFLGRAPSRYKIGPTYCCHWHFPETFIREIGQSGEPVVLTVYTKRRPWDKAVLWLRVKYLKLAGRL